MTTLLVVGGGKMGEALVGGLLAAGFAEAADVVVIEPVRGPPRRAGRQPSLGWSWPPRSTTCTTPCPPTAVVAVKPQQVAEVSAGPWA
jgi:pyrroline-5-carboxylate reductase